MVENWPVDERLAYEKDYVEWLDCSQIHLENDI